jgi:peptidoglycan/LPS O-acetylase OafA/YrhL
LRSTGNIYFSGLNGLRFFAALSVVVTHIELIKGQMGFENLWDRNKLVFELGGLGVVFFFVLSGFLITYLLLEEKKETGTIAIKKFYLRRILRIWPLYYLIILLGFLVLPHMHFMDLPYLKPLFEANYHTNFLLYLLFLPNLAFAMFSAVPHIGQTWSIGVEEQFYILWPVLIRYSRNILRALIAVVVIFVAVKAVVLYAYNLHPDQPVLKVLKPFLAMTKMESMAIGGLGAYFLFYSEKIKILYGNIILALSIAMVFALVYLTPPVLQNGIYLVYSVLFLIIILNVSCYEKSFLRLENSVFRTLGNISYGIYMYHLMVVALVVGALKSSEYKVDNGWASQLLVYSTTIMVTIGVAWMSYNFFEKWFLKLKRKFTIIESGTNP